MIFSHIIKNVLCGNKSTHCGFEHSSRTRESHLCIDLSVLTARNQATGLGYVIQTRKVWGEDLKTEGFPDQGSGLEEDDAKLEEDLQAQSI